MAHTATTPNKASRPPKRIPAHVTSQLVAFGNGSLPDDAKLGFAAVGILAGRSRNSLYRDVGRGMLHPIKSGRGVYFAVSDVRQYLNGGTR